MYFLCTLLLSSIQTHFVFLHQKLKTKGVMKKILCICLLSLATFFSYAGDIPPNGNWSDDANRTISSQPTVANEGSTLLIHFAKSLTNLSICVADSHGQIFYEDVISGGENETVSLPVSLISGKTYQFVLMHELGFLYGNFIAK